MHQPGAGRVVTGIAVGKLTEESLPDVYRAIRDIEQEHVQSADGAMVAAQGFGAVVSLGALVPAPRAPGPATTAPVRGPPAAGAMTASPRALARALLGLDDSELCHPGGP